MYPYRLSACVEFEYATYFIRLATLVYTTLCVTVPVKFMLYVYTLEL